MLVARWSGSTCIPSDVPQRRRRLRRDSSPLSFPRYVDNTALSLWSLRWRAPVACVIASADFPEEDREGKFVQSQLFRCSSSPALGSEELGIDWSEMLVRVFHCASVASSNELLVDSAPRVLLWASFSLCSR